MTVPVSHSTEYRQMLAVSPAIGRDHGVRDSYVWEACGKLECECGGCASGAGAADDWRVGDDEWPDYACRLAEGNHLQLQLVRVFFFFFFKQKTAYEI